MGRHRDQGQVAGTRMEAREGGLLIAVADGEAHVLVEAHSAGHVAGDQCDGADALDRRDNAHVLGHPDLLGLLAIPARAPERVAEPRLGSATVPLAQCVTGDSRARSTPNDDPPSGFPRQPTPYDPGQRIGIARIRTPVAAKTAFAMAGATAMTGVSPAPTDGRSGRSRRWISSSGTSANRGTR
jgi:hypothetical protein